MAAADPNIDEPDCQDAEPLARRARRNIVLLSDGTGNSAAKARKTNVWQLYQALDLGDDDQIAFYDDGVGTSGFRPLQLLGGAFGWGLSRNVRDLYEFLCRHYREGDHIYIFGFSRGAFTARTLAALIGKCGILDCSKAVPGRRGRFLQLNTREGLKAGVKLAYRSYRRGYSAPVAKLFRWLRDRIFGAVPAPAAFRSRFSFAEPAAIKFVGVWDTVDAVGLPIDELSTLVDQVFYPHRFPDQDLSDQVERACHAIAIDDERHTFHPVLWNERGTADSERISQVWFAGMHSSVGGGYPENDLAYVSLQWMMGEVGFDPARDQGLRFDPDSVRDIDHRTQPLGKMYDSRRGLGVYYRYNPRRVATLCDDRDNGVLIAEPKIHRTVFERIAENITGYAPAGLPTTYRVVDDDGAVSELDPPTYESAEERGARAGLLERAQHHVFWRRVIYYLFVLVTLALVLMPYYRPPIAGAEPDGPLEKSVAWVLGWLLALLPGFVGSWAEHWTAAWTQAAPLFLVLAAIYGWLLWHSRVIDANIHRLSEVAWWHIKRCPQPRPAIPTVGIFERLARSMRHAQGLQTLRRLTIRWLAPIVTVAAVVFVLAGAVYRVAFHLPAVSDGICGQWLQATADLQAAKGAGGAGVAFDPAQPCVDTGADLQAGRRYRIEVAADGWKDASYDAAPQGLSGYGHYLDPVLVAAIPARRHVALSWFALVGEIGRDSGHTFPINRESVVVRPTHSGRLYLYVNDAIDRFGDGWDTYYRNNAGAATVSVTPLD